MDLIERFKEKARAAGGIRVLLPEGADARIQEAAGVIQKEGWAVPILVSKGDPGGGLAYLDLGDAQRKERYAAAYLQARPEAGAGVAARIVRKPLVFGAAALASGDADCLVAGAASTTANVISVCALTIGLDKGIGTPSSFFLMDFPDYQGTGTGRVLVYADCAVTVQPSAEALADIALASAASAEALLDDEPLLAMLSFSTKGSGHHDDSEKVRTATEIARQRRPALKIDGELQADSALVERVARKKCPDSAVAGRANVLVFPDLDAGNIAYKLSQYLGGARAYGPILQGFRLPCSDLSRGARVGDIVGTAAIVAAVAASRAV